LKFYETSEKRRVIASLDYEAELLDSIKRIVEERGIKTAVFWVIGAVKNATIGYYDQNKKTYVKSTLNEPMEITSCIGNVTQFREKTLVHAHVTLANSKTQVVGGHLYKATVYSAELYLVELDAKIVRVYDENTGLNLFG